MVDQHQHGDEGAAAIQRGVARLGFGRRPNFGGCGTMWNRSHARPADLERHNFAARPSIQQGPRFRKAVPNAMLSRSPLPPIEIIRQIPPPTASKWWNQLHFSPLDQRFATPPIRRPVFQEQAMTILKWALIFFLVSVVAGILGFTGISAASADVARFLFYVFVVIFLVLLILGLTILRV
jgi:uncharacterized membrane protein YtjA (UPF0391 family)